MRVVVYMVALVKSAGSSLKTMAEKGQSTNRADDHDDDNGTKKKERESRTKNKRKTLLDSEGYGKAVPQVLVRLKCSVCFLWTDRIKLPRRC
ncbi:hypothetical protein GWI33_014834 [Rhynchophorus ferrugineus]|uniref:Uncharacterized protein n=1 Tax=Rhynchophorus ferrugineus TaxID=354439 RepID=A0A834I1U6_RHYFE|nr:hypothetical protein GWI33_014834 [Rhynchophorus ferrugineus]